MRRWAERFGLILFGLFLALALLEGGLRIASLFFGERSVGAESGAHTILTLGDSHTYGVRLPEEESYPGQLMAELEGRKPGTFRVVNLGLPGTNSSQVRKQLPGWLARYQPGTIIVLAGINNMWNVTHTESFEKRPALARWAAGLRSYRLLELAFLASDELPPEPEAATGRPEIERIPLGEGRTGVEHRDQQTGETLIRHKGDLSKRIEVRRAVEIVRRDLEQILSEARLRKVRPIFMTYAANFGPRKEINAEIRRFGLENAVAVVDLTEHFEALLPQDGTRTGYFLSQGDDHPNARGYSEVSALLADLIAP